MRIVEFEEKYRDDMIFMVLEAKNALGVLPRLNSDLLDVQSNYYENGTKFWLALDDKDRVLGCLGYEDLGFGAAKIRRFYVKCNFKRQGIGSQLLQTAEESISQAGYREVLVHFGGPEYMEAKSFFAKKEYIEYQPNWMKRIV